MNIKISQAALATAFLLSVLIKEGLSINCYQCNSYEDKRCNNPEGIAEFQVTCSSNETMCRKIEQEINIGGDDVTRTHRQCATRGSPGEDCLERTGTYRFKSWYCECNNKDYCNSASTMSQSLVLSAMAVFSLFVLRKLL
ncbi:uncharacterized protein LOC101849907 [Aplysia californica]|uniref:Uncharacterized protein LOC101849907 n=1 Tax=Aplysia californica TaxID=6500 RepID=A0ABM0JFI7_APLCA|nr:uncharacterized protein LOC101849907 [Aplysia californica]